MTGFPGCLGHHGNDLGHPGHHVIQIVAVTKPTPRIIGLEFDFDLFHGVDKDGALLYSFARSEPRNGHAVSSLIRHWRL